MNLTSTVVLCLLASSLGAPTASVAQDTENPETVQQPIIAGTDVLPEGQTNLGLVRVNTSIGACSGVLLTERWVLTAGHCFSQSEQVHQTTVTLLGRPSVGSDLVYVWGAELDLNGNPSPRGYDLALIRLESDITPVAFRQKPILYAFGTTNLTNKMGNFYGQGMNSYYQPGPPPVPPAGYGIWRSAALKISRQVSRYSISPENQVRSGWEDFLVAEATAAGQVCAPGDGGGPVFWIDERGQPWLAAIQFAGGWQCANP